MGMAFGMSGQVDAARKVFLDAIKKDPDYPLYYYNLACADAEQGDAATPASICNKPSTAEPTRFRVKSCLTQPRMTPS
jgi:tetratricopeptide (TPR) repeat protein